jgi:hypothetical protein
MRTVSADARAQASETPIVLATLYAPGFTVRCASEPVEIEDEDGDGPYLYDARLVSVTVVDREVDLFSLERGQITRTRVALVLPEDLAPVSLEATHHHLAASRCEVALIWPGETWRQRDVVIGRGLVSGLRLGLASEPIEFVAEALPPATGAPIGDASRLIQDVALGFTPIRGKQYPVVIGRCYRLPGFKGADAGSGLLLAGHHFASTTVPDTYEDGSDTPYVSWGAPTVENGTDTDGNPKCRIVAGVGGAGPYTDFSVETYSAGAPRGNGAFTFDAADGGVRASSGGHDAALYADGVIDWILTNSGERYDFAKMRATYQHLRGLDIGVYVDKEIDALTLLRTRILPFLPLIEETGPDGMWLRYIDIASQPAEVDLVEGVNLIGRTGPIEQVSDGDDLVNRVTIRYFYDHFNGSYAKSYTVDSSNHPLCALSESLFGVRAATIDCPVVWDDATAARLAWMRMNRLALHRFASTWVADPSLYWLREGAIVRLTSESLGITARKAVVRRARATRDPILLTIEPIPGVLVPETI